MKIAILKEPYGVCTFEGDQYVVDLNRKFEEHKEGDLVCYVCPFFPDLPLKLEFAIRKDGSFSFRSWRFDGEGNNYLHTREICQKEYDRQMANNPDGFVQKPFIPTQEQIDTVNGLFSGRIRFEGLKLPVGGTVQDICPIDVRREEELTGKNIWLSGIY